MISTLTVVPILVTFGLLSLVTARPTVSHQQNVNKQGYYTFFPQQQGLKDLEEQVNAASIGQIVDAYNNYLKQLQPQYPAKEQGITISFPQQQSAEKQGRISWSWAQQQAPQYAKQEGITFTYPYTWHTQQAKGQRIIFDQPYFAKQEGITFTYPQNQQSSSAKEQGLTVPLPQLQGIRIPGPFGKEQGITFSYPQTQRIYGEPFGGIWNYQQKSSDAKEQSIRVNWHQQLNAAIQGALCSAAYDAGKLADVAAYVKVDQDTLGDLLKQFGSKLCDKDTNDTEE